MSKTAKLRDYQSQARGIRLIATADEVEHRASVVTDCIREFVADQTNKHKKHRLAIAIARLEGQIWGLVDAVGFPPDTGKHLSPYPAPNGEGPPDPPRPNPSPRGEGLEGETP
ncbi:hypothetical protein Pan216_30040 [Planctomycetes bacterium Pan216]|uniref:Uncharacterized protein n=1 Tax=Kolteria novifilia TaxID=2527975 RepID=A0A518B582_9BACT|nr:hypothetical protein Pan216_30040 [Planctomycetes bacterium Pan216]